jgi:hypothetical protein
MAFINSLHLRGRLLEPAHLMPDASSYQRHLFHDEGVDLEACVQAYLQPVALETPRRPLSSERHLALIQEGVEKGHLDQPPRRLCMPSNMAPRRLSPPTWPPPYAVSTPSSLAHPSSSQTTTTSTPPRTEALALRPPCSSRSRICGRLSHHRHVQPLIFWASTTVRHWPSPHRSGDHLHALRQRGHREKLAALARH